MPAASSSTIAFITLGVLGVLVILAYLLLGRTRSYLLYLGAAFLLLGMSLRVPSVRYLFLLLALTAFVVAVIDSISDTRERIRQFREEQRQREEAFSEFMNAIAKKQRLVDNLAGKEQMPE